MPLPIDPTQTFDLVLQTDAAKPEPERAVFRFRYLSARELLRVAPIGDATGEELHKLPPAEIVQQLFDALRLNLVEMRNVPPARDLEDMLTTSEAWELYWQARRQTRLEVAEKNDSGSPLSSAGEGSATAAPDAPSAPTQ